MAGGARVGLNGALVKLFRTVEILELVFEEVCVVAEGVCVLWVGLDGALVEVFRTVDLLAIVFEEVCIVAEGVCALGSASMARL